MSGFDPSWLALREPADHAARDRGLLRALSRALSTRDSINVVDLGCGTGSNLRAVAPQLGLRQAWRLLDHDARLLETARDALAAWADRSSGDGDDLILSVGERSIRVAFARVDLASEPERAVAGADLVTAAALFDLVSEAWIERLVAGAQHADAALYAALNYDGRETWLPPHPADAEIHAAFLSHQEGHKGFGPSAGPRAAAILAAAARSRGYAVETAESPWKLGPGPLATELATGIATAAGETGRVSESRIADWLAGRASGASCTIGHLDVLALR